MKNQRLTQTVLRLLWIIPIFFLLSSCEKDTYDMEKLSTEASYSPGLTVPLLAYGNLRIDDFIPTNDTLKEQDDHSLLFSMTEENVFSLDVSEILDINAEDIGTGISGDTTLGERTTDDTIRTYSIVLDEFTDSLPPDEGNLIKAAANNGTPFPEIPPPGVNAGTYKLDTSDQFEWMEVSNGWMVLTVENHMPVEISMDIRLTDLQDFNYTFDDYENIPPGGKQSDSCELTGETIHDELYIEITNYSTPGGPESPDLENDSVFFVAELKNMKVIRGEAKIDVPEIDPKTRYEEISLPGKDDVELRELNLSRGRIQYGIENSTPFELVFNINFPKTTRSGVIIDTNIIVPPKTPNETGYISLNNSVTDLVHDGNPNTFGVEYDLDITPTDEYVIFDSSDAVIYNFTFEDIEYEYAKGYFGHETHDIESDSLDFDMGLDFFDRFEGEIELSEPQAKLIYDNSIGVPINMDLNITAEKNDGSQETANKTGNITIPQSIGESVRDSIVFDKNNGLDNLLTIPPPKTFIYSGSAESNPEENTSENNFITNNSSVQFDMNVELPLKISSAYFGFQDTMAFEFPEALQGDIEAKTFNLHLYTENYFPFNMRFTVSPYNSAEKEMYDPIIDTTLLKMPPDLDDGVPQEPSIDTTGVSLNTAQFDDLQLADSLIIKASLNTKNKEGDVETVTIKTDYTIYFEIGFDAEMKFNELPGNEEDGE